MDNQEEILKKINEVRDCIRLLIDAHMQPGSHVQPGTVSSSKTTDPACMGVGDNWARFAICAHCGKSSHEVPVLLYVQDELIKFTCIHCFNERMQELRMKQLLQNDRRIIDLDVCRACKYLTQDDAVATGVCSISMEKRMKVCPQLT